MTIVYKYGKLKTKMSSTMTIAKKLTMLPVPIQLTILRMSLISNFNYTKDNPEWKMDHELKSWEYLGFIKWGSIFSRENPHCSSTTAQEMNTYWKLLPDGGVGITTWSPCKRYISTDAFRQMKDISLNKMSVVYLFTRYKGDKKLPLSHTQMMEPLIEHNSLGKLKKTVRIQDVPEASFDNALLGASPFWFYRNCRCSNCDDVRKLGYEQISEKEKKKVKPPQIKIKKTNEEYRICVGSCKKNKPKSAYGNNQWRKGERWSRCKDCISQLNVVQKGLNPNASIFVPK